MLRSQARFNMDHAHAAFCRDQRAGNRGVDVAYDQHSLRLHALENGLKTFHYFGGLDRVARGADFEVMIGAGNPEVEKKTVVHRLVVMLASVQQLCGDAVF